MIHSNGKRSNDCASLLQDRNNDMIVVLGPFNQHIMTPDNRAKFIAIEKK
jgi:hypothetical protein